MTKKIVSVILLVFLVACERDSFSLAVIDLPSGDEATLAERDFRGKRIFINYWAEWCKPCIEEIPELNTFQKQHAQQALVIGVNFDRKQGADLLQASKKAAIEFAVAITNPRSHLVYPDVQALPTTVVLDEYGAYITSLVGPQTLESLESALQQEQP